MLRPARIFCTRKGRPRRQLRAVDTLRIWPPCQGCGWARRERTSDGEAHFPPPPALPRTHPFHDPAVHLHPLSRHLGRPAVRPVATRPLPECEEEKMLAPAPQLRNFRPRLGPRGLAEARKRRRLPGNRKQLKQTPTLRARGPGISRPSGSTRARHGAYRGGARKMQSNPTLSWRCGGGLAGTLGLRSRLVA